MFNSYKCAAARRGILFLLTRDEFRQLTGQACHYCGMPPLRKYAGAHQRSVAAKIRSGYLCNGVDRIDSAGSYTLSNCVTACKNCNFGKGVSTYQEYLSYLDRVADFRLSQRNANSSRRESFEEPVLGVGLQPSN